MGGRESGDAGEEEELKKKKKKKISGRAVTYFLIHFHATPLKSHPFGFFPDIAGYLWSLFFSF